MDVDILRGFSIFEIKLENEKSPTSNSDNLLANRILMWLSLYHSLKYIVRIELGMLEVPSIPFLFASAYFL